MIALRRSEGNVPEARESLTMRHRTGVMVGKCSFMIQVGIGSKSQLLVGHFMITLVRSSVERG